MKLMLAAALAAILVLPAQAEDKSAAPAKASWGDFFKTFKENLTKSAVSGERKRVRGAQRVGAVRGNSQGYADPNEPGLKGDTKSAKAKKGMALDSELGDPGVRPDLHRARDRGFRPDGFEYAEDAQQRNAGRGFETCGLRCRAERKRVSWSG